MVQIFTKNSITEGGSAKSRSSAKVTGQAQLHLSLASLYRLSGRHRKSLRSALFLRLLLRCCGCVGGLLNRTTLVLQTLDTLLFLLNTVLHLVVELLRLLRHHAH